MDKGTDAVDVSIMSPLNTKIVGYTEKFASGIIFSLELTFLWYYH